MTKNQTRTKIEIIPDFLPFPVDLPRLRRMLRASIRREGLRKACLCVRTVNDREIAALNRRYLGHKGPTDVLSFDLSEEEDVPAFDVMVNAQRAGAESRRRGLAGEAELALYALHGLLHCLGYDDLRPADAAKMHQREDQLLHEYGYGKVYGCK